MKNMQVFCATDMIQQMLGYVILLNKQLVNI